MKSAQLIFQQCSKLIGWGRERHEHAAGELMTFRRDASAAKLGVDVAQALTFVLANW